MTDEAPKLRTEGVEPSGGGCWELLGAAESGRKQENGRSFPRVMDTKWWHGLLREKVEFPAMSGRRQSCILVCGRVFYGVSLRVMYPGPCSSPGGLHFQAG